MTLFVNRPLIAFTLSAILCLAGLVAIKNIPILQFPKINSSALVINTHVPGSSAQIVKGFVTAPIEKVVMTIAGIDYIDSDSTAGQSTITAWLKIDEDSNRALTELNTKLSQITYELPDHAEDPVVELRRADRQAALFYLDARTKTMPRNELTDFLNQKIVPKLTSITGVQEVGFEGGRLPAMRIQLDSHKMFAMNVSALDVKRALARNNILTGFGKTENNQQQMQIMGNTIFSSVSDFENMIIKSDDKNTSNQIHLQQVAKVFLGEETGLIDARFNKDRVIYISIWPEPGSNEIEIGDALYKQLEKIKPQLPEGLTIEAGYDGTLYMRSALKEIFITLIETVVLVSIVVVLMMGSLRSALVPLMAIPISILGAIAAMQMMGFSLNLLTILAIVLSVGLVVDDAIVVVEYVARLINEGKSPIQAAKLASKRLLSPIIAMTFTLAAVYVPLGFVSGLTGSLFSEFAFTLSIAVIMSGIVALTLSPVISAFIFKGGSSKKSSYQKKILAIFDKANFKYIEFLRKSYSIKPQAICIGLVLSLLCFPFYFFSSKQLAPIEDQNSIEVIIEAAPDTSISYVHRYMDDVIDSVSTIDGYQKMWQVISHNGGFGGIELLDSSERDYTVHDKISEVYSSLANISGLKAFPTLPPSLPTAGYFDVEMVVTADDDYASMLNYARELVDSAYETGLFMYAFTDLEVNLPQASIVFDHDKLAEFNMTVASVSEQLALMLSEQSINRFNGSKQAGDARALRVIPTLQDSDKSFSSQLLDVPIEIRGGVLIPLRNLARIKSVVSPRVIRRFNQQASFTISGGVLPHGTQADALEKIESIARSILPESYAINYAGISRQVKQESNSLLNVLAAALVIVYLALAIQFNNVRLPLVVLLGSVPLALSSALLFTFLGFSSINLYAQIGLITLVGLIAKNGILMTEFAHELQEKGVAKLEAITEAARFRFRPILMTTLATVLGHIPLVLVTGAGAEARNSIGIILVAGMAVGTFLTLFLLPHLYILIASNTNKVMKQNDY
tara:strand:- start:7776 stop:10838 length:3063 start_codon:yes stop_codon:yes gene_type:complete